MSWSSLKTFSIALSIVLLMLLRVAGDQAQALQKAELPNPDSFYKLVLLRDADSERGWAWSARDNAPQGFWMHWSEPHSQVMKAIAHTLEAVSVAPEQALLWAGGLLTLLSMALIAWPILWLLSRQAGTLPTLIVAIAFATNIPLYGYGQLVQLTHHIFMLVPLAWALLSLHGKPSYLRDARAGAFLALALWISPETMPFVLTISALRAAQRLQSVSTQPLWSWALTLIITLLLAWQIDPPPPTYSPWTLDHLSLAWLLFAALLGALMLAVDALSRCSVRARWLVSGALTAMAFVAWLSVVPEARQGAMGLLPETLRTHWWGRIHELQPAHHAAEYIAYAATPMLAISLCFWVCWRQRDGWFLLLALAVLAYAALGLLHIRMGAASALIACYALGIALGKLPAFRQSTATLTRWQQAFVVMVLAVLPAQVFLAHFVDEPAPKKTSCELATVADELNQLSPGVVLLPINLAPELLYRTQHQVIAGNYHRNILGLMDYFSLWLGLDSDADRKQLLLDREVKYALFCQRSGEPTVSVKSWFAKQLPVQQQLSGGWNLYTVDR